MPTPAYMSIIGEIQGNITENANSAKSIGNIWQSEHINEIIIQQFEHIVTVPRDPQSGQPTGQRVHKPLTVTKVQDRSSPLLFNALVTGEKLPKCVIRFFRTSVEGKQEHYYTITMYDALLVDIDSRMAHCQDGITASRVVEEILQFTYLKIEVCHDVCGVSGSDDWRKPIA